MELNRIGSKRRDETRRYRSASPVCGESCTFLTLRAPSASVFSFPLSSLTPIHSHTCSLRASCAKHSKMRYALYFLSLPLSTAFLSRLSSVCSGALA